MAKLITNCFFKKKLEKKTGKQVLAIPYNIKSCAKCTKLIIKITVATGVISFPFRQEVYNRYITYL